MAVVAIDSGPIEATDRLSNVPKESWRSLMLARRHFLQVNLSYDCRCLVEFVSDAGEMYGPLGYASVDQMIRDGYGLEPAEIEIAVEWLRLNPPDDPTPLERAKELGQRLIGIPGGKAGPGRGKKTGDNITRLKRGTSHAYTVARLDRDRPDLAARVHAGELSANAAAIEAGFKKKPTPLDVLSAAWRKASAEERAAFLREIGH